MSHQFVYFADPMCSWCWGFAPVMEMVTARFGDRLPVRLILGGLRPGTSEPLNEAAKQDIRAHWTHVQAASGQPFDFAFFTREGFVYDTEPASRAVVAARRHDPEAALPFLNRIHRAFYAENRDVTSREVLGALAAEFGLDRDDFEAAFDGDDARAETRTDFEIARRAGVTGFPTLVAGDDAEGYEIISRGFQPWERIEALITASRSLRLSPPAARAPSPAAAPGGG